MVRRKRRWPWLLLLALIGACALVAWFPARWAWPLLASRFPDVQMRSVHGSVWQGRADQVSLNGQALGKFHWTLDRSALWGHWRGRFSLQGPLYKASGQFARLGDGDIAGRDLHLSMPAAQMSPEWFNGMRPSGTLDIDIGQLQLSHGWPVSLHGVSTWKAAALDAGNGPVDLGTLSARWLEVDAGVVNADIGANASGPLRVQGHFTGTPLNWRLNLTARPRGNGDPRLRQVLSRLGTPKADGGFGMHLHGGLLSGDGT